MSAPEARSPLILPMQTHHDQAATALGFEVPATVLAALAMTTGAATH